jgi:hypothetical protein
VLLLALCNYHIKLKYSFIYSYYSKIDELKGFENAKEDLGESKEKEKAKIDYYEYGGFTKPGTKSLAEDLVRANNESKLVYCKFGKRYVEQIEK